MTNEEFNTMATDLKAIFAERFIDKSTRTLTKFVDVMYKNGLTVETDARAELLNAILQYNMHWHYIPQDTDAMAMTFAYAIKGITA